MSILNIGPVDKTGVNKTKLDKRQSVKKTAGVRPVSSSAKKQQSAQEDLINDKEQVIDDLQLSEKDQNLDEVAQREETAVTNQDSYIADIKKRRAISANLSSNAQTTHADSPNQNANSLAQDNDNYNTNKYSKNKYNKNINNSVEIEGEGAQKRQLNNKNVAEEFEIDPQDSKHKGNQVDFEI